ncbi:MAG: helix-turn-helix domain-containing protein [Acidobacteriia bacterium]|nr:helix-turn-helix domain-containing protein [Terriglobia bacterium]
MTDHFGHIPREVKDIIEESNEWKAYQDLLLKVEQSPNAGPPGRESPSASTELVPADKKRRFLEPKPELLKDKEIVNKRQAATALGVTLRTLDRYVADKLLTPVGDYARRRFKTKDLLSFMVRRKKDR